MNYIYIYEGTLPKYIKNSLENTLKVDPDANIYFCNNQNFQHKKVTSVQINSIISKSFFIKSFSNMNQIYFGQGL